MTNHCDKATLFSANSFLKLPTPKKVSRQTFLYICSVIFSYKRTFFQASDLEVLIALWIFISFNATLATLLAIFYHSVYNLLLDTKSFRFRIPFLLFFFFQRSLRRPGVRGAVPSVPPRPLLLQGQHLRIGHLVLLWPGAQAAV